MDASKRYEKFERDFFKEWVHRHPLLGTSLGLHSEFDDKMPEGSLEKELDDHKFLHRTLAEAEKFDPKKLTPSQGVSRDVAIRTLKNWIFDREELRYWESVPEAPQLLGQAIFQILSRNYAPLGQRMRAIMKRLDKMPKYIELSRTKLRQPVKLFIEIELETITRLPGFFNLLKDIGREHLPATPQRDLNRLIDTTQNALERYSDWLIVDVLPDCREEFAIGEEKYKKLLHARGVEGSPGHWINVAESEIAKVREKQKEVARAIKRKVAIEDIRDMLKQQHPENFDGALRFVRDSVGKSRQFNNRSKFAQLPEGEQLYVIETPSYLRHLLPFGGYWPPARFESKLDGYYFVTPGDCDSDKLKEHNYGALAAMTIHQGYPGRHVQTGWAIKHPSPLRGLFEDPAAIGGWGAYCEERAKEMGYDDTPPSRFMQLQSMLLQAVRMLIDVRLATGKMTINQSVEALIDNLAMDRICAEAETRRYITSPGAPVVHFSGREAVKELKKWAKDKLGPRFTETFFHTSYLQSGPIPIPLAKREVELKIEEELKKPLEKPKEDHHKKDDKKHAAHAAPVHPPKAAPKAAAKVTPKAPAPAKKTPAPKKASKPKPRPKSKPKSRPKARPRPKPRPKAKRRPAKKPQKRRR
jgi:uncharacterized protein (DUF885 family)